jgi:hypothetical protein
MRGTPGPEVLLAGGLRGRRLGDECPASSAGKETGFIMRDLLFVLIYVAMVLTPAVVAVRSGREPGKGE